MTIWVSRCIAVGVQGTVNSALGVARFRFEMLPKGAVNETFMHVLMWSLTRRVSGSVRWKYDHIRSRDAENRPFA